jgi:hypothetical protein
MQGKKAVSLDQAIERIKQEKLQEALGAGCVSVREIGAYLSIEKSRAHRLLRAYGYTRSTTWGPTTKRRKTAASR